MDPVNGYLKESVRGLRGEDAFTYLAKAREVSERKGIKVISFGIGQPDLPTFSNIVEAAKVALDRGLTGYTETEGIRELREAIADYLNQRYHAGVKPNEVIVTTGTKTAIFLAMASYIRPGDEVIIPDPTYPAYPELTKFFGGKPVYVPLTFNPEDGFRLNLKAIEGAVSDRTRAIVLNNPHNPTGAVFRPSEVSRLLEVAKDHGLLVIVDEIYDNFLYEEGVFKGILELEPDWRRYIIYTNGFSKTFSMTGWRLGYLVASGEVIEPLRRLAANTYSCPPSIAQWAGVEALRNEASWRASKAMIELFKRRRDVMYNELRRIPGFEVWRSEGAFYMYPRVKGVLDKLNMSVEEFANWLLEEHGVVILPGTAFSESTMGREYVRLSFALDEKLIIEGLGRVREAIENFKQQ
ncbi:MAG: aminotransferase class I/II-fold pyridoxal phosphate-dependent enzyme [Caldivirga sp.]|jgi:aspartate aminotransferase|nr:aminotransferase class I/II-fold pyridoxal phosphate-dependent enzyme [Caldivirga sp.]